MSASPQKLGVKGRAKVLQEAFAASMARSIEHATTYSGDMHTLHVEFIRRKGVLRDLADAVAHARTSPPGPSRAAAMQNVADLARVCKTEFADSRKGGFLSMWSDGTRIDDLALKARHSYVKYIARVMETVMAYVDLEHYYWKLPEQDPNRVAMQETLQYRKDADGMAVIQDRIRILNSKRSEAKQLPLFQLEI